MPKSAMITSKARFNGPWYRLILPIELYASIGTSSISIAKIRALATNSELLKFLPASVIIMFGGPTYVSIYMALRMFQMVLVYMLARNLIA
jgi:hypothetical protein